MWNQIWLLGWEIFDYRLEKEIKQIKDYIWSIENKLANGEFANNAPENVVAKEKEKLHVRHSLVRMLLQPPYKFFKMYFLKQGFREGIPGLIIAILGMFYVFLKYAKLWELKLQNRKKSTGDDYLTSRFFKDSADDL